MSSYNRYETEPLYPLYIPEARNFATVTDNADEQPFTPAEIDSAYGISTSPDTGSGITVAVIDAFSNPQLQSDFHTFGRMFGLPENDLEIHFPNGESMSYVRGWSIEASADTQWVYAASPAARIMCVFASDAQIPSLFSAVEYAVNEGADIISMSWGSTEFAGEQRYTQFMKDSGRVFVASAGDTGGAVLFPSSSDAVVSVGGTQLHRTGAGNVFARSAWINGGGGPSRYTPIPAWQSKFAGISEMSGGYRATPDVALDASENPGYAVYNSREGGLLSVGGTSVSAPVFAGICAALLQNNGGIPGGRTMPEYLYYLAGETAYSNPQYYFNDITVGTNGRFDAMPGYDMCTGLGAPVGRQITGG